MVALGCIWGSSFILIKRILPCYTPIQYALCRIIITGICFSPWILSSFKKATISQRTWVFIIGVLGYFMSYLLMGVSQTRIDSSLAGILTSLTPLFTFIVGLMFFSQPFRWKSFMGVGMGLIGCLVLIIEGNEGLSVQFYSLFLIGSVIISSFTINLVQKHLKGLRAIEITSLSFGGLVIPSLMVLLVATNWQDTVPNPLMTSCTLALIGLALVGTVLGSLLYYHILSRSGALYTSTVTYIIPLTAIIWGVVDGEHVGWEEIIGFAFILGGIKLIRN
ncbi:MAG: EamA family transporter [Saprospiraceae bacterium]|nr:EamA family transporter [Saprospiraceae bacterium]